MQERLPIHAVLPKLQNALREHGSVILQADPGAGKTTVVPLSLLEEPWLAGRKILMLEPRRLAARAAAHRMAETLGEPAGRRVGYRMRGESKVSRESRIEVLTEGVLTRMLRKDPTLEGVGLVIFDEFHERSLQADLGLALALQARELFREDLKILLMSATLEGVALDRVLPEAVRIESRGRSHPVELRYLPPGTPVPRAGELAERVAETIRLAIREHPGDILAFLPGAREIRRCEALLRERPGEHDLIVAPLYGALEASAQRRALAPAPEGRRKVILATNIAETSLTIEGVRIVVDGGWERRVRYDGTIGMDRYETRPIAIQSATQRAGRAGRTAPGVCYRLWSEGRALAPVAAAPITVSDLAPMRLELAAWGADPRELSWIDPPPEHALEAAESLLRTLGMLGEGGTLSSHGEAALEMGLHPRLAHMVLRGRERGVGYEAALLAVVLEQGARGDLRESVSALHRGESPRSLREEARRLLRRLGIESSSTLDERAVAALTALAYPERLARRRGGREHYRSMGGRGLRLRDDDGLGRPEWLAVAAAGGEGNLSTIHAAAVLEEEQIVEWFGEMIVEETRTGFNEATERVEARSVRRLGRLILSERPLPRPEPETAAEAWLDLLERRGLECLSWSDEARRLCLRSECVARALPGRVPKLDEAYLRRHLREWLGPYLSGIMTLKELQSLELGGILRSVLGYENLRNLEALAPDRTELPSGSKVRIDYSDPGAPVLAAKLQECFGWERCPSICEGKVVLTVHLLSPAGRALAVTKDLVSFWRSVYPEVRKQMRGRYPKHPWPEDPLTARATGKTKKWIEV